MITIELVPADNTRCQAMIQNDVNAMTLGGKSAMNRCTNIPTVIATESNADEHGVVGAMSLCNKCLEVAKLQLPENFFTIENIETTN